MATMTNEQLDSHVNNLMHTYHGDLTLLANAVGALNFGKFYGWRVLVIIYSPLTIRKYQKVLGFNFKDVLPEIADCTERSHGYQYAMQIKNFWKVVSRDISVDSSIRNGSVLV